jgi:hypothetical protein
MNRTLLRAYKAILRVVTCISCGAEYGQPHTADCEFQR